MIALAANQTMALLQERLSTRLAMSRVMEPDLLWTSVAAADVCEATTAMKELGARYLVTVGIDERPLGGGYGIVHLFSLDPQHLFVAVDCPVPADAPRLPSITPLIPGAAWAEREFRDMIGVEPEGHPDPRRLVLPDDWPEGVHPLRRDVAYNYRPPSVEGVAPELVAPPKGTSVIPVGPFFPVLEEPARFRLFVEGETVVDCDYRGFYNHRGIEKLGDSVLTWDRLPFLAERICGICGFIHSTCYCQAVENAAGIVVPRRAAYIRTLMLELERIHSHLLWLGIAGHIIGFDTVLMQTWRIREPVMWLTEAISGNRKTYGMNMVGGVRRDITPEQLPRIREVIAEVAREAHAVREAIVDDDTLHARTKGVGPLSTWWAKEMCVVGPPARASNVAIDARLDHPYAAYDDLPPRRLTQEGCDTWARVLVRLDELEDSIRIVQEALDRMPAGPVRAEIGEVSAGRVGVSAVEAPRGEAIHFVMTGGANRPYRWRVRAPTFPNLQAVPAMVKGQSIADVPISIGSLDPCFSCTERMETVDVRDGRVRVLTRAQLAELAQQARARRGAKGGGDR
ncbi:MAG: NADH-quinone oxidoreductase subunit C [Gemmatimonadaceae bacterium]|nr:NADH-quinone oxidoreductase subunit C [Gemmatimonadaceae bacterium]